MRQRARERGAALLLALGMLVATLTLGLGLLDAATREYRASAQVAKETKALALAEAAVEDGLKQLNANGSFTGTPTPLNLGGGTIGSTVAGSSDKVITGTGIYGGVSQTVRVVVRPSTASTSFPEGAIVANGSITTSGSPHTLTVPATQHVAAWRANGDIVWDSANPSADGPVEARGTVRYKNWQLPNMPYGHLSGAPPISFPTPAQKDTMAAAWKAQAMSGTQLSALPNLGINPYNNEWSNVTGVNTFYPAQTGPRYYSGSLAFTHTTRLRFDGPDGSVVYVDGDFDMGGDTTIWTNCTIVAKGRIHLSNSTHIYITASDPSSVALVSLAKTTDAVKIDGGSSSENWGVLWALNGGAVVAAGAVFKGSLIVGGNKSTDPGATAPFVNGDVATSGNAAFYYPAALNTSNRVINTQASYEVVAYRGT